MLGCGIDITAIGEKEMAAHVRAVFQSPSGRIVGALLDSLCFMQPRKSPLPYADSEQVMFRHGRMTLHQTLEFFNDPENVQQEK